MITVPTWMLIVPAWIIVTYAAIRGLLYAYDRIVIPRVVRRIADRYDLTEAQAWDRWEQVGGKRP